MLVGQIALEDQDGGRFLKVTNRADGTNVVHDHLVCLADVYKGGEGGPLSDLSWAASQRGNAGASTFGPNRVGAEHLQCETGFR